MMNLLVLALLTPQQAGTLPIASGTIEAREGAEGEFAPLSKGSPVKAGTWIRTGPGAYAVLDLQGGSELRIGENTEIFVNGSRSIEIKQGRIFPKVARGSGEFSLKTEFTTMKIETVEMDIIYKPRVPNGDPAKMTMTVFAGMAAVPARGYVHPQKMTAGYVCDMIGTQLNTPDRMQPGTMMATKWIHPILRAQGKVTKEVELRCNELYMSVLKDPAVEKELRELGPAAISPLVTKLKQSSGGNAADPARIMVARIVVEEAMPAHGNDLLPLLKDNDPDLRVIGTRALTRLAGNKDQGFNEGYWRANNLEAGQKAWEQWVRNNGK